MVFRLLLLLVSAFLSSCVYGPASLNVRVTNFTPANIRVETADGEVTGKVQVVNPGGMALAYAPLVTVHGPKVTTLVAAGPLSEMSDGSGRYKYAHIEKRGVGHHDVVFEVMIDEEGRTWANSVEERRVPFPSRIVQGIPQDAPRE